MIRVYLPTEKVPKKRYIYGLYAKECTESLVIQQIHTDDAVVFCDIVPSDTSLLPVGFVLAVDMMRLLKDNLQVPIQSLTKIGKSQATWHTPTEKE